MMKEIIEDLSKTLNLQSKQISAVLDLLAEGATIPFIARYRKERTGNLNEDQIRAIEEQYRYQTNLFNRKQDVIRLIDEKGLLTEEIKNNILNCQKITEVEDIYRPYKEKKKTKASEAIKMGLEPLAKIIMSFPTNGSFETMCNKYEMPIETALENAGYIISEWISDNAYYRKWIRQKIYNTGQIVSKVKKGAEQLDETKIYEMYYNFNEPIKFAKHYRILALNRGEKEKILTISLNYNIDEITTYLEQKIIKNPNSFVVELVKNCIKDALKRLILPSIEREIRSELTEKSETIAIKTFGINLEHLLLTRPFKKSRILGFDPAFRTGCKLAVLDESGNLVDISVIYPHEPKNDKVGATKTLRELITKYNIDLIAIGNGTASRESEAFVAEAIKGLNVKYIIVSEAGASVYSASELAKEEFPNLSVEQRSAISIGRRVQDPLSELVKIEPKSIGVGEYQHDVNQKELESSLDFTVSKVVNEVGVNVNTASKSILKYISGLNKKAIDAIMEYKTHQEFKNREEFKKLKGLSTKMYEQAVGFLRIPTSNNALDHTGIHPESYNIATQILQKYSLDLKNINSEEFKMTLEKLNPESLAQELNSDSYTIEDIIKELKHPGLDPRENLEAPVLKSDILHIEDLKPGMELQGTVRNVASFGAFVDIGLKNDGLIHISKLSKNFVKNPIDIVNVGDIITCYVDSVDLCKKKVSLSLIK